RAVPRACERFQYVERLLGLGRRDFLRSFVHVRLRKSQGGEGHQTKGQDKAKRLHGSFSFKFSVQAFSRISLFAGRPEPPWVSSGRSAVIHNYNTMLLVKHFFALFLQTAYLLENKWLVGEIAPGQACSQGGWLARTHRLSWR